MTAAQKTPFQRTLHAFAERKVDDGLQLTGKALPASVVSVDGAIVTVKFEVQSAFTLPLVTMPLFGSEYVRLPIQPGCKGVVLPADARLGGMSGLAPGVADLSQPGNLSALVFLPIGNTDWFEVDGDVVTIYGPEGVTLMDILGLSTFKLTPLGVIIEGATFIELIVGTGILRVDGNGASLTYGSNSVVVNAEGVGITGPLTINGLPYIQHEHSGVTTGGGVTGGIYP